MIVVLNFIYRFVIYKYTKSHLNIRTKISSIITKSIYNLFLNNNSPQRIEEFYNISEELASDVKTYGFI